MTSEKIFVTLNVDDKKILDLIPLEEVSKAELSSDAEKQEKQLDSKLKTPKRDSKPSVDPEQGTVSNRRPLLRTKTLSAFQHFNCVQIETNDTGVLGGRIYRFKAETKAQSVQMVKTLQKYSALCRIRAEKRGRFEMTQVYLRVLIETQQFRFLAVALILAVRS